MCFNEIFYFFFFFNNYFGPYWIDSRPVSVCFGPNQTDLGLFQPVSDWVGPYRSKLDRIGKPKKKKKFGHRCACSRVHGRTARPCISDLGAPAQSVQPCFWDGHLFLGFVLILGFQRGYCFSNHYDCSINPNLVYIVCPYLDCISWFFIRNRCFRKLKFFKFLNFHWIRNMDSGCYLYVFCGFDIYQTKH